MAPPSTTRLRLRDALIPALVVWVLALLAGVLGNEYEQYVAALVLGAMMVGVALVILVGLARMITLAAGAMMGIGSYTAVVLMVQFDAPFLLGVLAGTVLGGLSGLVLGLPATRFRGHHLAMVTMVFQFVVIIAIGEWDSVTGGVMGLRVPTPTLLGVELREDWHFVALLGLFTGLTAAVGTVLVRGHFGKVLRAMSSSEVGAEAFGVYLAGFQVMTFVISSAVIAAAGALFAPQLRILDPEAFGILPSVLMLAYPIVGGMTSIWGGLLGGGLLRLAPEALRFVADYQELLYAAIVIASVVFFPGGLVSLIARARAAVSSPQAAPPAAAPAPGAAPHPASPAPPRPAAAASRERNSKIKKDVTALRAGGISKSYGSLRAVQNVNLNVTVGSIHGLIGPNGAGKTTFFNMISGFIPPDEGSIELFGRRMAEEPARARIGQGVARTFQNVAVYRTLSCLDNVILGLGRNGVLESLWLSLDEVVDGPRSRANRAEALRALEAVGLRDFADEVAGSLSLGNQRRLEIARAIVSRPKMVLLDEPVSGVGAEEEERLKELLRDLNQRFGITMFVIEHNIRFVVDLCHRLSVMSSGEIIAEGDPQTVIASPDVRRIYFGEG